MLISEKELKLIVNIEGGNQVLNELKNISKIDNFNLVSSNDLIIQDSYLDSESFLLAKNNSYLRIRSKDGTHLITFRHEIYENNQIRIDEITHSMNDAGVNLALSKLKEYGYLKENPDFLKPFYSEIFLSSGFREVIRLSTKRNGKELYMEDVKIGNIKFDEFFYHYFNPDSIFYEIEIDTYRRVFYASVLEFLDLLKKRYNYRVEKQTVSKYKRGLKLIYNISIPTLEV
jgi:hypothetical protein